MSGRSWRSLILVDMDVDVDVDVIGCSGAICLVANTEIADRICIICVYNTDCLVGDTEPCHAIIAAAAWHIHEITLFFHNIEKMFLITLQIDCLRTWHQVHSFYDTLLGIHH